MRDPDFDLVAREPQRLAALRRTGLLDTGDEESFDRLGRLAQRLTGAPVAMVSLVDDRRAFFKSCLGLAEPFLSNREAPLKDSVWTHVIRSKAPLVIPDIRLDPSLADNEVVRQLGIAAYLGIPLVDREGYVLGSFCVFDRTPHDWTLAETSVMVDLAQSVMVEIVLRQTLLERDQLAAVMETTPDLVIFSEIDGTVTWLNQAAQVALGTPGAKSLGRPLRSLLAGSLTADVTDRAVASASDAGVWSGNLRLASVDGSNVPVSLVVMKHESEADRAAFLSVVARDVTAERTTASELARLASLQAVQQAQVEWFFALAGALTGAVSVDDVVQAVTDHSADAVGAVFSNLALLDANAFGIELMHGPGLSSDIGQRWPCVPYDDSSPVGRAIRTGMPVLLENPHEIRTQFPVGAGDADAAGFRALAAMPILKARAAIVYAWTGDVEFDVERRRLLRVTADLVGDALERARLYEHEHAVADLLQQSMLPQYLPEIGGAVIGAFYAPGTVGLHVGGDWYDVVDLGGGRSMIAVGDVVGHGLEAAAAMGQLRSAFAALAHSVGGVAEVVQRLDRFVFDIDAARLSSVAIAEYDGRSGDLAIVLAGHLPPLIHQMGGLTTQLPDAGPPLGIDQHVVREIHRTSLNHGDVLLLYTDGLVEERGKSIDFAIDRLRELLSAAPTGLLSICRYVYDGMGRPQNDDVAILSLVRTIPQITELAPTSSSATS